MKHLIFVILLAGLLTNCGNVKPTWPTGATLCRSNFDCLEGQYCGFVPGYTAAVCRGESVSNFKNVR